MSAEAKRGTWTAALLGGVIGAALVLLGLFAASRAGLADRLVREAFQRQPEMLIEASDALRDKQYAPLLDANRAALEKPFGSSWEGAAKPEVTLVEFYDFACGYCKASLPVLDRLLKEDPTLRAVYREFPILGPESEAASRLALAASKAGRFQQFHDTLYAAGRPSPATLQQAARAAGIPFQPPQSPEIDAELRQNFQLASALGVSGTPLFIVGDRVLNGAVGYDVLKQAIERARTDAK